jgi:O-antigen ligase
MKLPPISAMHRWLLFFTGVILFTMVMRGAGLKALGSSMWGGMFYVQLLITIGLVFTLPHVRISARNWPPLLVLMGVSAMIPVFLSVATKHGLPLGWLEQFFPGPGDDQMGEAMITGSVAVDRLATTATGVFLLIAFLILVPIQDLIGLKRFYLLPVLLGIAMLTLLSGSRTAAVTLGLTLLVMVFLGGAVKPSTFLAGFILLVGVTVTVIVFSDQLPPAVQRSLAWLPGFRASDVAMIDAEGTLQWRLQLWEQGIRLLPEFWLIGKGYTFYEKDVLEVIGQYQQNDLTAWAVVTSSFHNGLLSLAVGLGVFGLIAGLGVMISACRRHWSFYRGEWNNPLLKRCHYLLFGYFFSQEASYILFYGDVQMSFPILFTTLALLEGVRQADSDLAEWKEPVVKKVPYPNQASNVRLAVGRPLRRF